MLAVNDLIHVDATMWALFVSAGIPPLVGFLTKLNQSPAYKAGMNLFLNLLNSVLATVITVGGHAVISKHTVITTVVAYLTSHAIYKDFWKSKGITSSPVLVTSTDIAGEHTTMVAVPGKLAHIGIKIPPEDAAEKAA